MLTQDQINQQRLCQNEDCDCRDIVTQEQWSKRMESQGWVDFGYEQWNLNEVHEDDRDYDRGVEAAYQNR